MKLTGGEIVVQYLIKEGIPYAAGIPGHGCLALVDAFRKHGKIKMIQVRHEQSAVHLADGFYRASGKPMAVFTSIGPGAVNTATGLATSYVDSTAVIVFTGDTHTHMFGVGVLQEIERVHDANFSRSLEPLVKRYWQAINPGQLPRIMRRAFAQMKTGRPGPVLVDLPMDVQADSAEVSGIETVSYRAEARQAGDGPSVKKAAALLKNAKRPVILAGGGINTSQAWAELRKLAEATGAAVVTTMMGKGVFPEDHPQYAWHAGSKGTTCGNYFTSHADVLLAVGCRFADETCSSYKKGVSFSIPPTKLIHVDIDPGEIGKNYPVSIGIIGDAKTVLTQILDQSQRVRGSESQSRSAYIKEIQKKKEEWFKSLSFWRDSNKIPMTISRFLKELRRFLDRDAVVVTSSGNSQAQVFQEFPFYYPGTCITTGGFSTMGFTLPASLGAKLALPERQVIGIIGDGDFQMTIEELATAVQHNIPVVIALLNNSGWISIKDLQEAVYGKDNTFFTDFSYHSYLPRPLREKNEVRGKVYSPDFTAIAKGFGCYAEKITRPEQIAPAFSRAFRSGKPAVVEVITNREQPYCGGVVAGWWDVPIPAYMKERRAKYERERAGEALR